VTLFLLSIKQRSCFIETPVLDGIPTGVAPKTGLSRKLHFREILRFQKKRRAGNFSPGKKQIIFGMAGFEPAAMAIINFIDYNVAYIAF